jgi:hypothetical protein
MNHAPQAVKLGTGRLVGWSAGRHEHISCIVAEFGTRVKQAMRFLCAPLLHRDRTPRFRYALSTVSSTVAGISAEDHTAIVGLPLLRLAAELRQLGFLLP